MSRLGHRRRSAVLGLSMLLAPTLATASVEPLAVIPFQMVNARVVVPVSINGSPPLNFVFDNASGGTVLHSSVAEALGLGGGAAQIIDGQIVMSGEAIVQMDAGAMQVAVSDTAEVVGFVAGGSGVAMSGGSAVATIALGEFRLDGVELSVLPLTHITMPSGEPIDGIIGYDILRQHIVEVDYDEGALRIFSRDAYIPPRAATPHEVTFPFGNMAQPCVTGDITLSDGEVVSGTFVLDAGAGAHVVLNSPFVREHELVSKLGVANSATDTASGVTPDETPVVKSELESLSFCGFTQVDVPVTLNLGTTGFLAAEGYAGVIGNRVLSRYNIAYDYAGAVVYLEPVSE